MSVQTSSPAAEEAPVATNTMLPPDPLLVERERAGGILNSARLLKVDSAVASDLIARGVPLADARAALIDAAAAVSRATQVNTVVAGIDYTDPAGIAEDVATVLAHRLHSGVELKGRAREMRGLRAAQLVGELMSARGIRVNRFDTDRSLVTRAGMMTTSDLPMVLASSLNKALLPQFEQARSGLRNVARPDSARDFKTVTRHRVGEFPQLLKVAEHGEYQSGAVGEAREAFQLEKFGRILSLSWEMVIGDDLEALSTSTSSAALAAATLEADQLADAVTSNPVLSDGVQVYHSTHNNVGTPATIGNGSVGELSAKMRTMKGLDGRTVLNIAPAYIVVPAAIEYAALQLVSSAVVAEQASNVNVWTALTPVVEPRLDAVDNNAWYLFASPGAAPTLSIAYLEGEETPMVETKQGFEIDGVHIKVRWALKPYWAGYRGTAYNAGA